MFSLKTMMRLIFFAILLGVTLLSLVGYGFLDRVSDQSSVITNVWMPRIRAAEEIGATARDYRISEALRIMSDTQSMAEHADSDLKANADQFASQLAAYRARLGKNEDSSPVDNIQDLWRKYRDGNEQMLAFAQNNQQPEAASRFRNSASRFYLLADALNTLVETNAKAGAQATATAQNLAYWARIIFIIWCALGIFVVAAAVTYFDLRGWRVLARLADSMQHLAKGEFDTPVAGLEYKNEVGDMARAVQVFKDNSIEMRRLEAVTATQRQAADQAREKNEEERRRNDAILAEAERQRTLVVVSIAQGLDELSHGNVTYRIAETFAPEFQKLKDDFNSAMAKLQETLRIISAGAIGIHSSTEEISDASDKLAQRTENQAANLEETAAALEELTTAVRTTAESAKQAKLEVTATKSDAEQSGEIVRSAVSAMSEIERSSQQISEIIGVMDGIAFQTNLLALNAGVEAARAGEAGKGFAVVASEVRALAQRSTAAAKEIKGLISASTKQVGTGVDLVGQTGKVLQRIVAQVTDINGKIGDIAAAAEEQALSLVQINTSVTEMDKVTQQNAAMAEESTAASHALAQEANELARLISQFQLGTMSAPHAPIRRAAAAPANIPSVAPVMAKGNAILRTLSSGNAAVARKLEAAIEDESWEDF